MWESCGQSSNLRCQSSWFFRINEHRYESNWRSPYSSLWRCLTTNDLSDYTNILLPVISIVRSCITPKSSHWCPNDCFPSNLPALEKQDTSPSSCHIVICCNFYPGNARLIWLGLDNLSFRHLWSSWPPGILFYKREMMDKTANF